MRMPPGNMIPVKRALRPANKEKSERSVEFHAETEQN